MFNKEKNINLISIDNIVNVLFYLRAFMSSELKKDYNDNKEKYKLIQRTLLGFLFNDTDYLNKFSSSSDFDTFNKQIENIINILNHSAKGHIQTN